MEADGSDMDEYQLIAPAYEKGGKSFPQTVALSILCLCGSAAFAQVRSTSFAYP